MRVMRILLMFDLPTGNKYERKTYSDFKKFLLKDGYHMEQFSVYSRISLSRSDANTHLQRLRNHIPPVGSVIAFILTEKRFANKIILTSKNRDYKQTPDIGVQLTLEL